MGNPFALLKGFIVAAACAILLGCGFHLRGDFNFPFKTIYINHNGTETGRIFNSLMQRTPNIKVVKTPQEAEVLVTIAKEDRTMQKLTINIQGMVREYSLKNSVHFTVKNQAGYILIPTEKIELERSMTYDYSDALSRDKENDLLRHDMANEAAQQLIRQLAAIKSMKGTAPEKKPKKGKAQTSPAKQKPADVQDSSPSPSSGAQSLILRR